MSVWIPYLHYNLYYNLTTMTTASPIESLHYNLLDAPSLGSKYWSQKWKLSISWQVFHPLSHVPVFPSLRVLGQKWCVLLHPINQRSVIEPNANNYILSFGSFLRFRIFFLGSFRIFYHDSFLLLFVLLFLLFRRIFRLRFLSLRSSI